MRTVVKFLFALSFTGILFGANVAFANLITNGGFESPTASPGVFNYSPPDNWSTTGFGGFADSGTDGTTAPEGNQYGLVEIFSGTSSSLSQTVTFPTTGQYTLTYFDADRMGAFGDLSYDVNLTQTGTTSIASGLDPVSTSFNPRSFSFFATAGSGTLTFFADGSSGQNRSAYFDGVTVLAVPVVVPVPEPSSLALLGLSCVGLCLARRKRLRCNVRR